jgi:hypothetical protein
VIDPEALPFDPADPEYSDDSDGAEEEQHSRSAFTSGLAALRDRFRAP